jgi:UDP-glucose 6-dehydrogenase
VRNLELLGDDDSEQAQTLAGQHVAIWGLTYKPGTDTLRRSSAIELCRWLLAVGATVTAHDPAVIHMQVGKPLGIRERRDSEQMSVERLNEPLDEVRP